MNDNAYELATLAMDTLEQTILNGHLLTRDGRRVATLGDYLQAVEAGEKPISQCNLDLLQLVAQGQRSYEALAIATGWPVEACEDRACWLAALGYLRVVPGACRALFLTEAGAGMVGKV